MKTTYLQMKKCVGCSTNCYYINGEYGYYNSKGHWIKLSNVDLLCPQLHVFKHISIKERVVEVSI